MSIPYIKYSVLFVLLLENCVIETDRVKPIGQFYFLHAYSFLIF